jgi:glycosyltransferase involved in cell wall biosynthesis
MAEVPLISIITVNLNNLEGLKKTMTSVFEQTWKEFEYIIIDGGSTDGSKEFIESHSNKIDYWVSEPDTGIYNAMNKGIKAAKGEYLLFLNSGDWLYDEKVLKIATEKLDGCDVLYGNMVKVFPDGREVLDKGVKGEEISLRTFVDGNLNHQATFIGKHLFKLYGFYDENLNIVSDWKLFLIALGLNNSKVKYINMEISYYDMSGVSSNFKDRDAERLEVLKEIVPLPIFIDYTKLKNQQKTLNAPRFKKFLETDQKKISRKLHSIIFRLFS